MALEPPSQQPPRGVGFRLLAQRLADAFRRVEDQDSRPGESRRSARFADDDEAVANGLLPRFPVSRQGYNCVAVDEYVGQLEDELSTLDREMAQLRVQVETNAEVRSEIQRIGAETSAVLIAAHEQREEMLRLAREEADRCVAEARSQANALTAEYETRLRELKAQSDVVRGERERMLDEVRSVSVALAALADSVHEPAIS